MQELESSLLKNMSVLYVEDDPLVATQTVNLLKHYFHHVFDCSNAEDALELFRSNTIHIIITDIELPGMDGLQFCAEVRKSDHQVPIFITTVHDDKDKLQQAVKLNLIDYLVKPVSITSIEKTLMEALKRITDSGTLRIQINHEVYYNPLYGHIENIRQSNPIPLTQKEIKLLNLLLQYKNQVVPRETIEQALYQGDTLSDSGYKSLLFRLRKKVGKDAIVSLSGLGIKLQVAK